LSFTQEFIARSKETKTNPLQRPGGEYRYREANFEYGEQLAVLGIIEDSVDADGQPTKLLKPVSHEVLTKEFCEQKGWSQWDRQSWMDLTQEPSIILTDMPKYFQGISLPALPARPSYAQIIKDLHTSTKIPSNKNTKASAPEGQAMER